MSDTPRKLPVLGMTPLALHLGRDSSLHERQDDSEMEDLVDGMDRLCDSGFNAEPRPMWLHMVTSQDEGHRRQRVAVTSEQERAQSFQEFTKYAGFDETGRPSLCGVVPDRQKRHAAKLSHTPRFGIITNKVIKSVEKVRSTNRHRVTKPRCGVPGKDACLRLEAAATVWHGCSGTAQWCGVDPTSPRCPKAGISSPDGFSFVEDPSECAGMWETNP